MQNKRLNNRVGGASANALTMPIVVILSILHVLIIAVTFSIASANRSLSNTTLPVRVANFAPLSDTVP